MPDEVDQRLGEIETAVAAFEDRPVSYDPAEIARAGIFVSIDGEGGLRIDRGFVRPEDEAPVEPVRRRRRHDGRRHPVRTGAFGPARRHHHRRSARSRGGGVGRGRRHPPAVRPAGDGTHRPPHARAARRAGGRTARRLPDGAACALPRGLLSLCLRHLPGNHGEEFGLRRPGAGPGRDRLRPRRSMRGTINGPSSCPKRPRISGMR